MTPDPQFMKKAVEEACTGLHAGLGGPFGAVIVKNGEIVARGCNRVTSSNDVTAHAEMVAIREACKTLKTHNLSGCELYTSCYPCPMCMGASFWAHLDAVYYAATAADAAKSNFGDSTFHDFMKDPHSHPSQTWQQLTIPDFIRPFREWDNKPDKVPY